MPREQCSTRRVRRPRGILPAAGDDWVQIAHAAGGIPQRAADQAGVLEHFADRIARGDPRTAHVIFDLSYVPLPGTDAAAAARILAAMRRIGIGRFVFGSDFNVEMPDAAMARLRSLGLTACEWSAIAQACAPWAC
ncbi:MAG TPA: hypothetical protein VL219_07355 [Steroidobacteraceae bacterium]|jgi:hypothetical protein|nr:hypothetical protein [Steroidobacteraceae bacterium]